MRATGYPQRVCKKWHGHPARGSGGIGILPMVHGCQAHATLNRLLRHSLWAVIVALMLIAMGGPAAGAEPNSVEQALGTIRDCMARVPAPWPEAWQREYLDTIREVLLAYQDAPRYGRRSEIIAKGFGPYWQGLPKSQDRCFFEVNCAQVRWYVEALLAAELPGDEQTQKLRRQYEDLCDYAVRALLAQFPFLDPNAVHRAGADHLAECNRQIDVPLVPIYLHPFSEEQMEKIKQRWHDLRYARVDLWRALGGEAIMSVGKTQVESPSKHPHYVLAERSLAQLLAAIRPIVAPAPEYYRDALRRRDEALKRRQQAIQKAWSDEKRLQNRNSGQILQAEQISFLLAALLESPQSLDGPRSTGTRGESTRNVSEEDRERR